MQEDPSIKGIASILILSYILDVIKWATDGVRFKRLSHTLLEGHPEHKDMWENSHETGTPHKKKNLKKGPRKSTKYVLQNWNRALFQAYFFVIFGHSELSEPSCCGLPLPPHRYHGFTSHHRFSQSGEMKKDEPDFIFQRARSEYSTQKRLCFLRLPQFGQWAKQITQMSFSCVCGNLGMILQLETRKDQMSL